MNIKTISFFLIIILLPFAAFAKTPDELKKQIILDKKKLIVMENIKLNESEDNIFWPIYDEYQERLFSIELNLSNLYSDYVDNFESINGEDALTILKALFEIDDERQLIMRSFFEDLKTVLPARKLFLYMQIENNLAAIEQYNILKQIPLLK